MKKTFLFLAAVACMNAAIIAQDEPSGNIAIDLNLDPAALFDALAGPMFNMPMLKVRYFIASDMAIRAGLDIDYSSSKDYTNVDATDYTKTTSTHIVLSPGIEKHLKTGKFAPYIGAELPITNHSTKSTVKFGDTTTEYENPNGGYMSVGLNAVLGADFYILPNLYVGAEFNPGFTLTSDKDQKVDNDVTVAGGSSFGFGISSSSGIRIGFRF